MTEVFKVGYKCIINGKKCWRTLFHGINRRTYQTYDELKKAEKKMVKDGSGGQKYLSGIHCFKDPRKLEKYFYSLIVFFPQNLKNYLGFHH